MAEISTVIFDMDGVIVNSEQCWEDLEQSYLLEVSPNWDTAAFTKLAGMSNADVYRFVSNDYGVDVEYDEFKAAYDNMAETVYGERTSLIPDVDRVIAQLESMRIELAIASSSPPSWIETTLTRFSLDKYFRVITSGSELEQGEGKPKPRIYQLTAERIGVETHACAVIEDSRNGVMSAKAAGMFCFGLRNGHNDDQDLSNADVVLQTGFRGLFSLLNITA